MATGHVAILGAGSFGTAVATIAARNGHNVVIYCRNAEQVASINETHRNPRRLSEYELSPLIRATTDFSAAVTGAVSGSFGDSAVSRAREEVQRTTAEKKPAACAHLAQRGLTSQVSRASAARRGATHELS